MAGLASACHVQERAAYVVVADFNSTFANVRHVAIGAGHAAASVDALAPRLEFRVLRLEQGPRDLVLPIGEPQLIVEFLGFVHLQAIVPRVRQQLAFALKGILDVALCAISVPISCRDASTFGS